MSETYEEDYDNEEVTITRRDLNQYIDAMNIALSIIQKSEENSSEELSNISSDTPNIEVSELQRENNYLTSEVQHLRQMQKCALRKTIKNADSKK